MKIANLENKVPATTIGFTEDQRKAYFHLIEFIKAPYTPKDYKRALVGPAGTGKTYLLRAVIQNCGLVYSKIGLSAPTHKACRVLGESIKMSNVKINTLQSDLGLRLNFDVDKFDINNPPFDPKGKIKIQEYDVYIIDEASMINRGLRMFLEKICITNKCKIIYIGDASQLSPVNEKYSSALKSVLTFKLNTIIRQGEDNPISKLLELLRYDIDNNTTKFISYITKNRRDFNDNNTKGFEVCKTKDFCNAVNINFSDEEFTRNVDLAKIIGYTNLNVNAWNSYVRSFIIKDSEKSVVTKNDLLISYTTIVNKFNDCVIKNSEEYILKDVVNYTHPQYGIKGFMVRFIAIHGGNITQPLFILDHRDTFSIEMYIKVSKELITVARSARSNMRAQRWKEYYTFKENCLLLTNIINQRGDIIFSRDLDYGFALTSHKSQGSTFDTVLVDVNDIVFDKNKRVYTDLEGINRRLYVACSRARNKLYLRYDI